MNKSIEILSQNVIAEAESIQKIPAPTFNEQRRAQYMFERFNQIGLNSVQVDEVGNVTTVYPGGTAKPLVISAHLDSIFPLQTSLDSIHKSGQIIAPGIGDNALGLASILGLASYLSHNQIKLAGDVVFAANVCEEGSGNLLGMDHLVNCYGDSTQAYLVIEGIGLGFIQNQALGIQRLKIEVITKGGHSWIDYGAPSAIHEIGKMIHELSELRHPLSPRTTLNVGLVQGGCSVNTIAPTASMEIDIRSEDQPKLNETVEKVKEKIRKHETDILQVKLLDTGSKPAGAISPDHPFIKLCKKALEEQSISPILIISSTDASLPISKGFPAACLAITSGRNVHSQDETIELKQVPRGLAQVLYVIEHAWDNSTF